MNLPEIDFRNPDYDAIAAYKIERTRYLLAHPEEIPKLKEYYKDHFEDFISDWGYTMDPRNAEIKKPVIIPFVMFPRQVKLVKWIYQHWKDRKDGLIIKSREVGVSWIACAMAAAWLCLHDDVVIGFGSRKEEYIDNDTSMSLFWKIQMFLDYLPNFLKINTQKTHMKIKGIDSYACILGEAGKNIGRGNRVSVYFIDEAAFIENQAKVDAALSLTTNCKMYISTIGEQGDAFQAKVESGSYDVFDFSWKEDPRKDMEWYRAKKKLFKHDPVIFAREIDMDYNAATTDSWISSDLCRAAQMMSISDIKQDIHLQKLIIGVDAAHFGDDESVISPRIGRIATEQIIKQGFDGPALAGAIVDFCERSPISVAAIVIELDGPGVSCYDQLRLLKKYGHLVYGVHTGIRLSDDKSFNLRALMYRKLKEWLSDQPCCIPNDLRLKTQISSMKYKYDSSGGLSKLLLLSKKDMRIKGMKSPDRADALALTFAIDENLIPDPLIDQDEEEYNRGRDEYTGY